MATPAPHESAHYLLPQSVIPRALAYVIDSGVVALAAAVLMATGVIPDTGFNTLDPSSVREALESNTGLAVYVVLFSYFLVLEGAWGRTVGKRVLGMSVVRAADGEPCGWSRSIVRNLVRPLDLFFAGLPGAVIVMFSPSRQRVGDMLGGTLVVRRVRMPAAMVGIVPGLLRRCPDCGRLAPAAGACPGCSAPPSPAIAPAPGPAMVNPLAGMMAAGQAAGAFRAAAQEVLAAEAAFGEASAAESTRVGSGAATATPADEASAGSGRAGHSEAEGPAAATEGAFVHTDDAPHLSDAYVAAWRRLMTAVEALGTRRAHLDAALAEAHVTLGQLTATDPILQRLLDEVDPYLDADDDEAVLGAFLMRSSRGTAGAPGPTPA